MLDRRNRSNRKTRRGVAAAELALMLTFLPLLMLITVDFARFAYAYVTITNCARNGAIWASSNSTAQAQSYSTLTLAVEADASDFSTKPAVASGWPKYSTTYNGTYSGTKPTGDGYVQVKVTWTFTTIVDYPGIPHTMDLSRTAWMRLIPDF